jgi:hypothetical protein
MEKVIEKDKELLLETNKDEQDTDDRITHEKMELTAQQEDYVLDEYLERQREAREIKAESLNDDEQVLEYEKGEDKTTKAEIEELNKNNPNFKTMKQKVMELGKKQKNKQILLTKKQLAQLLEAQEVGIGRYGIFVIYEKD